MMEPIVNRQLQDFLLIRSKSINLAWTTSNAMGIQALKKEVSKLSKAEQADLMHFMVELLATDGFQLSDEWQAELIRRETALEHGTSVGKPAREVLAK